MKYENWKSLGNNPLVQGIAARSKEAVREALKQQLEQMAFSAFSQIMKRLLYQSGYLSVHPSGRKHKRGKTPAGGLDLTAWSETELSSALTLVQVKQYKRTVSRRFVDELRGAMLRHGAEQGLLLTLSKFSKVAHQAAQESKLAPITLIEGDEVLDLLFTYRIGVFAVKDKWCLDLAYLDFLQQRAIGTGEMFSTDESSNTDSMRPGKKQVTTRKEVS